MSLTNDVEITLGNDTYMLRPTLKAANRISRQYGGFAGAFDAVRMVNLEVATFIVSTGTGNKKADGGSISSDDLAEAVYRQGVLKLTVPLAKYLNLLQHGGRDPEEVSDDAPAEQGNG